MIQAANKIVITGQEDHMHDVGWDATLWAMGDDVLLCFWFVAPQWWDDMSSNVAIHETAILQNKYYLASEANTSG